MNEILHTVYGFAVLSLWICSVESTVLQCWVYSFAVLVLGGFKCLRFCSAQSTLFNCLQLSTFPIQPFLTLTFVYIFHVSNQIYLVTLTYGQLTQASFSQKKTNVAKCFFDICNAEMAQWRRKSWNLDIQSQFSMSKNVRIFLNKIFPKMTSNFWRHCAISALKISKKHFATFDFLVKMKLVSTVHKSTSLSKSGYSQPCTLCA